MEVVTVARDLRLWMGGYAAPKESTGRAERANFGLAMLCKLAARGSRSAERELDPTRSMAATSLGEKRSITKLE